MSISSSTSTSSSTMVIFVTCFGGGGGGGGGLTFCSVIGIISSGVSSTARADKSTVILS